MPSEARAMRFLGNKTRLLTHLESFLQERGVEGGVFIDIFTGSASVARHFKQQGYGIRANDLLSSCYSQAVAAIEVSEPPRFRGVLKRERSTFLSPEFQEGFASSDTSLPPPGELVNQIREVVLDEPAGDAPDDLPLRLVFHYLGKCLPDSSGLMVRNYSPDGPEGRMYFRPEVARRIDAIAGYLRELHRSGELERVETHYLLASLLDAADRRANISGTYGAYLKHWQKSATGDLDFRPLEITPGAGQGHEVFRRDANELIHELEGDVLYLDPPYNRRQYAANYHVLEILAEHHRIDDLEAHEQSLYGKTGLRPYEDLRSDYCNAGSRRRPSGRSVREAFRDLVHAARVDHILVSYNEEGLLSREEIGEILAEFAGKSSFDYEHDFREVDHQRFRSDRNRTSPGEARRVYKVLEGKERDRIGEWMFLVRRGRRRKPASTRERLVPSSPSPPFHSRESRSRSSAQEGSRPVYTNILLRINPRVDECGEAARELEEALEARGMKVRRRGGKKAAEQADLILVLGGDGFLMETIRKLEFPQTPIFGVNFGNVGFLMNSKASLKTLPERIASDSFDVFDYPLLEARGVDSQGHPVSRIAFNDFTLERMSGQSIHFLAQVDGVPFNKYAGDGIIICTSGGSTAYNLAAGGPVVHPRIQAMVITPLYPHRAAPFHSLQFSLVLDLGQTLTIEGQGVRKRPIRLLVDGRDQGSVERVEIRGADRQIRLLRDPDQPFFASLALKFMGELDAEP